MHRGLYATGWAIFSPRLPPIALLWVACVADLISEFLPVCLEDGRRGVIFPSQSQCLGKIVSYCQPPRDTDFYCTAKYSGDSTMTGWGGGGARRAIPPSPQQGPPLDSWCVRSAAARSAAAHRQGPFQTPARDPVPPCRGVPRLCCATRPVEGRQRTCKSKTRPLQLKSSRYCSNLLSSEFSRLSGNRVEVKRRCHVAISCAWKRTTRGKDGHLP